jgi:hypothetical protein
MFVVEDGSGLSNATSLCSVAFADEYISFYANAADRAAWAALDDTAKQGALMRGTQYLVMKYDGRWVNRRTNQTQALPWPRSWIQDQDGFPLASTDIPPQVKQATCEAALLDMNGTDLIPNSDPAQNILSESVTAGPVQESITYSGIKTTQPTFRKIDLLLRTYLVSSGWQGELRRA